MRLSKTKEREEPGATWQGTRAVFDGGYIERLSRGDEGTERHFTKYFGDLLSIKLRGRLRSRELAENARQQTLLRALTRLRQKGSIDNPQRLGVFVNAISESVLSELFRAEERVARGARKVAERADTSAGVEPKHTGESIESDRLVSSKLPRNDGEVLQRAIEVIGDREEALRWLGTPMRALGYLTPISLSATERGREAVFVLLGRLEHGVL